MESTTPAAKAEAIAQRREARMRTPRLAREMDTVSAMLRIHCRDHHAQDAAGAELCEACATLQAYARKRLAACTFGADKPTCVKCPIHCYGTRQREDMREVMRYAGPRMLLRHPVLAIAHVIDGRRPAPARPGSTAPADPAAAEPPGGTRS